jgi:hypothetical protein
MPIQLLQSLFGSFAFFKLNETKAILAVTTDQIAERLEEVV